MANPQYDEMRGKYRILVAPLDWGLGHATRCVPIVHELLAQGCEVWLAGEGQQEALLRLEFPELPFLTLAGYRMRYSRRGAFFPLKIVAQIPRILAAIRNERKWLNKMVQLHHFDAIISDNRFGLYHKGVTSVFVTHQLKIKTGLGGLSETLLRRWNYHRLRNFSLCWVPDNWGKDNLGGRLSHPSQTPPIECIYIGCLSRFKRLEVNVEKGHILVMLSGPEPQRTIFENKIVNDISHYGGDATIARGLPGALSIIPSTGMLKFYNHLDAKDLNEHMLKAEWIIARSGYSTVMDLVTLQKKSILIPTPGQAEQEYLAEYLTARKLAFSVDQDQFELNDALERAKSFNYQFNRRPNDDSFQKAIMSLFTVLQRVH